MKPPSKVMLLMAELYEHIAALRKKNAKLEVENERLKMLLQTKIPFEARA